MSITRIETNSRLFAYSRWDAIPVLAALAQFAFVIALFLAFKHLSWWALIPLGLVYSVSISWNINGISHNFLHNPYFRSTLLNRVFSVLESVMLGISQVFYENVHKRHHIGNTDLPDETGKTTIRSPFTSTAMTASRRTCGRTRSCRISATTRARHSTTSIV